MSERWFRGVCIGSLDGSLHLRGADVVLRLTAGGREIPCQVPCGLEADISGVFGQRVRVTGEMHYDGKSGLPKRVDIIEIPHVIKVDADLARWRGAFKPFDIEPWIE
jgi:hypothetical protein